MSSASLDEHGLPSGYAFNADWEVTPRWVKQMREQGAAVTLIDCRTPGEAQTASIGADKLVPLQAIAERFDELTPHRDETVVVHCHHGQRSLQMAMLLRQQGFADVKSMAGGIDLWSRDIDASVPRY